MAALMLDTHAVIWYLLEDNNLSEKAISSIDKAVESGDTVYISAITIVELVYLVEKEKLPEKAITRLRNALDTSDSGFEVVALDYDAAWAIRKIPRDILPDMPDRLIAATAFYLGLPLVTCDRKIRKTGIEIIW